MTSGTLGLKTGATVLLALVLVMSSFTGASVSVCPTAWAGTANVATRWLERALDAVRSGSPVENTGARSRE